MRDLLKLRSLLRPWRAWLLAGVGAALLTLLANVVLMATSGWFIAAMAAAGAAGLSLNYFAPAALIRASAVARTLGRYGERLVVHEATLRLIGGLRLWFYRQLEPLAPAALQSHHSGDLLARIRADIDTLDAVHARVLVPVAAAILATLLAAWFLARQDIGLALAGAGGLLLAGVAPALWARARARAPVRRLARAESDLRAALIDGVQGLPELVVHGAADAHARAVAALGQRLIADQERLHGDQALAQAAVGFGAGLGLCALLWLAIPLLRAERLAGPELSMLALFALASFEAIAPLPLALQSLGRVRAAMRRLLGILDTPPAVAEPPDAPAGSVGFERFDIVCEGVTFRYPGRASPALEEVSLCVRQGTRVALIGATGAGKSTLFDLLLRFWSPQQGRIRIGGRDLAACHGEEVRRQIALVSQRTHLFAASIRENLLLARPDATQDELEAACRAARIHDFILELPEGYDTWVGETGMRLSGGQARRVAIARALLKDAPILLLDEPTEGLDSATERDLMQSLDRLMRGRTVLLVTHRPVGLDWVDAVLVLDRGRVPPPGDRDSRADCRFLSAGATTDATGG